MTAAPDTRPAASLSLDLDNQWSYMKTHGDAGWESFPSYLDVAVPRALEFLAARSLRMTFFIVGQDAALPENQGALKSLVDAGQELGNHSYRHEPWLHRYTDAEVADEIARAEDAIGGATGVRTEGFRGPGFSVTGAVLDTLARRGYLYDASVFPTFIGPLARAYYFAGTKLSRAQQPERAELFGRFSDGFRPNRPFRWETPSGSLLEIPVTTMPGARVPIHASYLFYLAAVSPALARAYWSLALGLCRAAGTAPSLLLHSLDFLDARDVPALAFFPAMQLPAGRKMELLSGFLARLGRTYRILPMGEHARELRGPLPVRPCAPTIRALA